MENLNNEKQTKKTFWQKIKKPFFFTLAFLPIIIVASILTSLYTFDLYPPEMLEEAIAAVGSKTMVILVTAIQNVGTIAFVTFFVELVDVLLEEDFVADATVFARLANLLKSKAIFPLLK